MIDRLSILLPTYNCDCRQLVAALHEQCEDIDSLNYEIIVADDGSSEQKYVDLNREIEKLNDVRYIIKTRNVGRSAIRNFLVDEARYEWILFIDGDLSLRNPSFIRNYLSTVCDVVVGGIRIGESKKRWGNNLRWKYEKSCEKKHSIENRRKNKYNEFRTTNFLIKKHILQEIKFNEDIHQYGYEDVLLGKQLNKRHIPIYHIDNPILLNEFEDNSIYIEKIEEAMNTLFEQREQLRGYSKLLDIVLSFNQLQLKVINIVFNIVNNRIKHCLKGNKPLILEFNIYRLLYLSHIIYTKS
ncbi:glycosyltransferase family 2 protein [Segatella albensis]|uniref:glycosyltransferase family 2 protein n=1 Tax=Segatella albensis TaxID=77768 RepID=UPI0004833DD0|nr:glycosyltransferase family 2 protein [Segatella albensis]